MGKDGKIPLKPVSRLQRDVIDDIEQAVINDPLLKQIEMLDLSGEKYTIYTITGMFLRAVAIALGSGKEINAFGLLTFYRNRRDNEEAEKTGNLVGEIEPGEVLRDIIDGKEPKLDSLEIKSDTFKTIIRIPVYSGFDEEDKATCLAIQTITAKFLTHYKLGISPNDWIIYLIAFLFIKNALLKAMNDAIANGEGTVNIADTVEITAKKRKNRIEITTKPGKECKLEIKGDNKTEVD